MFKRQHILSLCTLKSAFFYFSILIVIVFIHFVHVHLVYQITITHDMGKLFSATDGEKHPLVQVDDAGDDGGAGDGEEDAKEKE